MFQKYNKHLSRIQEDEMLNSGEILIAFNTKMIEAYAIDPKQTGNAESGSATARPKSPPKSSEGENV